MAYKNECVLKDRECIDCGECDVCDLDAAKICDNCCKCIDNEADYSSVYIDDIIDNDEEAEHDDIEIVKFDKVVSEETEED